MVKISQREIESEENIKHISKTDNLALRKDSGRCPVCIEKLRRNAKATKRKCHCASCNAVLAKELKCTRCNTHRVWRGKQGVYCHGCGNKYIGE